MSEALVVIERSYDGVRIRQREDGWLCLTDMAKASGKLVADWWRSLKTQEFLRELSLDMGIPISNLIDTKRGTPGGDPGAQGTWAHPQVAHHFAQWCSPRFAVQVTRWIEDIRTKGYAGSEVAATLALLKTDDGITQVLELMLAHRREIAQLKPQAEVFQRLTEAKGLYNLTETAKALKIPLGQFLRMAKDDGFFYYTQDGKWVPYAETQKRGLAVLKVGPTQSGFSYKQALVTPRGLTFFADKYGEAY